MFLFAYALAWNIVHPSLNQTFFCLTFLSLSLSLSLLSSVCTIFFSMDVFQSWVFLKATLSHFSWTNEMARVLASFWWWVYWFVCFSFLVSSLWFCVLYLFDSVVSSSILFLFRAFSEIKCKHFQCMLGLLSWVEVVVWWFDVWLLCMPSIGHDLHLFSGFGSVLVTLEFLSHFVLVLFLCDFLSSEMSSWVVGLFFLLIFLGFFLHFIFVWPLYFLVLCLCWE